MTQTAYSLMFDEFVRTRGIDEDDLYWSEDDWAAWNALSTTMTTDEGESDVRTSTEP